MKSDNFGGNAPGFRDNRIAAIKQYGAVAANAKTTKYGYGVIFKNAN